MSSKALAIALLAAALWADAAAAQAPQAAQAAPVDTATTYRREVFRYQRSGRPDPFRSLATGDELGVRVEDLALRGVVHHLDAAQSVAVLSQIGNDRRIRARVGDRIGTVRVLAIHPASVDVVVEEFGVARFATIEMGTGTKKGGS
jgi:hypothetical protein